MRILFASHFFPPMRNAGTENYTLGLAQALQRRGHEVEVVCAGDWERGAGYWNGVTEDRHGGVPVHRLNLNWARAGNPNRTLYDSGVVSGWLDGWFATHKPDLVHVTSAGTLGVGVLSVPHRLGIPTVLTLMDFWFLCPRTVLMRSGGELCDSRTTPWECLQCLLGDSNLYRKVNRWLPPGLAPSVWTAAAALPWTARARGLRGMALDMRDRKSVLREALDWPDVVFTHSRFVQEMFANAGVSRRVCHLPNGHDIGWLHKYRGKSPSPKLRLTYAGQLVHVKGIHVLVEAFKRLELGDRARLDIWGDPTIDRPYAEYLQMLVAGTPGITIRGPYHRTDLAAILEETDVLVVPSTWYENAPLVIQEAFATRTPVIATRLGGMAEAVTHGVNGLLFDRNDVADLGRQLRRVADEPTLLATLAATIPAVKTIEQEVAELEDVYRGIMRGHSRSEASTSVQDAAALMRRGQV